MTDAQEPAADDAPPKKKSKALLFGLIGAVLLGGGAFYGVYSGMVPLPFGGEEKSTVAGKDDAGEEDQFSNPATAAAAFVPMEEMVISLGPDATAKHLKVKVSIEVEPGTEVDVQTISPRIADVLNTYLRAVDGSDLENPRSMSRMRAQMLRRVRLVAPQGSVRDVLIQQFVLN
ncbi:MAG: flagellar basal body-associated FliL family protein [Pseudomonadota bacterium]